LQNLLCFFPLIRCSTTGAKLSFCPSIGSVFPTKNYQNVHGAANKSNPLPCFVNISTTNKNFYKKIYTTIYHSYLRKTAELY